MGCCVPMGPGWQQRRWLRRRWRLILMDEMSLHIHISISPYITLASRGPTTDAALP